MYFLMSDTKHLFYRIRKNALFQDSFWALTGNAIGKFCALIAGIVVARLLGKDIYGEYSVIRNTLFIVAVFSTLGLGYTATKFVAEYAQRSGVSRLIEKLNRITLCTSGIIALILFVAAEKCAVLLKAPDLGPAIRLLAAIVVFNAVTTTQIGVLAGLKAFRELSVNNIFSGLVTLAATGLLTCMYDFQGALWALLIAQVFNCILNYRSVKKIVPAFRKTEFPEKGVTKKIIGFSIPIALQESLYSLSHWGVLVLMANFSSYGQIGINAAVFQWINLLMFVPAVLRNVILAHLAGLPEHGRERRNTIKWMLGVNFLCTIIPTCLIAACSKWIVEFYGPSFSAMQTVLLIGILSTIFNSVTGVFNQEFISLGKNWTVFFIGFCREAVYVTTTYLLLVNWNGIHRGALCVSSAYTLSILFSVLLFIGFYRGITHQNRQIKIDTE